MPDTAFPAQFREARQQRRLTQVQVAEALGVSQSAVAQWESGRSVPSAATAAKIEKLLGVRYRTADQDQQPESRSAPPAAVAHRRLAGPRRRRAHPG